MLEYSIRKEFKNLTVNYILDIFSNEVNGRSPYHGFDCEEDYRLSIDNVFEETIKLNSDTTYSKTEIYLFKDEYISKIFVVLDKLVDKYERRIANEQ